ncbi:uncharacterized protein LOC112507662 [Cynara cardunculus var. scolymus]|uniref:Uncharacterized protein n=1 Tax=Cynara cardunculus var. scolymus TaxID=59895 RepID=A0A103YNU3_CYNCS|nr:uncharacterized protein LOC112507662 [Cynara cardunculus var. scolymus]KVI12524.1 hypothetical protein Ccrd_009064 [Cynara cardunculus var. scolymus]
MEGLRTRVYKGVKRYWGRRHYERLGGKNREESGTKRRKRFWRIRITPKLKLRYSPRKFIVGIRDGYMRMMMKMANSPVVAGSGGYGEGIARFGMKPVKEYDEKIIIEIYKSLAMRQAHQMVPIDAPHISLSR